MPIDEKRSNAMQDKMNLVWNLNELYTDADECRVQSEELKSRIEKMKRWIGTTIDKDNLKAILDEYFEAKEIAYRALVYGSLCYYRDAKNEEMANFKVEVEQQNANTEAELSFIDAMILGLGEDKTMRMLAENEELEVYRVYLEDLLRKKKHAISTPEKTELLNEISSLNKRYNEILSQVTFSPLEIEGKEIDLTASNAAKYLASRDRETRRLAFENLNRGYEEVEDEVAEILNEIMKRRKRIAAIEGYASVKEASLDKENIQISVIDSLFEVVDRNKNLLQKYMRIKKENMNLDEAHLYDLGVPLDEGIKRKFPIEEGLDLARSAFSILGPVYSNIVDDLLERGHIDAIPNDLKHPSITFSWLGYSFLNYHDSYNDLKNLVHEFGHSINDSLSQNLAFPYRISSVFAGETASITNEILLNRSLLDRAETDEERVFYLAKEIDNFITSVFRQTMYTELEDILYEKIEQGIVLDADLLKTTYLEVLKSYYGDDIVYDDLSGLEWMRVGRMFRWTYYSYTYATGLLIATAVYTRLKDGSTSIEDYIEFLSSGCKEPSLELLGKLGVNFDDTKFMDDSFSVMADDIEKLTTLLCKKRI